MSAIEVIVIVLLLLMGVPDLCRKLGRPALVYPMFIGFGIAVRPLLDEAVITMFHQAGTVGFLLLLFEVGLEVQVPPWRMLVRPLKLSLAWSLVQYPLILCMAVASGASPAFSVTAATALTACSVGMAYPAWKSYPDLTEEERPVLLQMMVILEVISIIILAVEGSALKRGLSLWIIFPVSGILLTIWLIGRYVSHIEFLFQAIVEKTTHWRMHFMVVLVLVVAAVGERLGLGAPKTAFFLGLFLSRAKHNGLPLEEYIAPISHRFLIPVFFVGLGMMVDWGMLFSWMLPMAFGSAILLLAVREVLHRRWFRFSSNPAAYLLLCPNLTIVALLVSVLDRNRYGESAVWLLLTGTIHTVAAVMLMPGSPGWRGDQRVPAEVGTREMST